MRHPDWNAVAAYLDGRLDPAGRAEILRRIMASRCFRKEIEELTYLRQAWELSVDAETLEEARALVKAPGRVTPLRAVKAHR